MHDPNATSFQSHLATVLFGTAPEPEHARLEALLLQRLENLLERATSKQILMHGPSIDSSFVKRLSGHNLLHVARIIESRAPAAIENMVFLQEKKRDLQKGSEMAKIFAPAALDLMIEALQMGIDGDEG